MKAVGLSEEEKCNIYRVVAAVLHLGNIEFEENLSDKKGRCSFVDLNHSNACLVTRWTCFRPVIA